MYSPKINEKLIPRLYKLRKRIEKKTSLKYPMTKLVNEILMLYLENQKIFPRT